MKCRILFDNSKKNIFVKISMASSVMAFNFHKNANRNFKTAFVEVLLKQTDDFK